MIWLSWRQFRTQGAAVAVILVVAAVGLVLTTPDVIAGATVFDQLTPTDRTVFFAGVVVLAVAPALIGAFWGAPLLARELEAGTHRLAWNQSVTRTRWLATRLGLTTLAAAVAVGVLSLAVSWWAGPVDGVISDSRGSLPGRITPVTFAMRGVAPPAYGVFALVLGVAAGLVLRRTVAAMAVTLVVYTLVQVAVPLWVRPHLAPPVRQTVAISLETLDGIGLRGGDPPKVQLTLQTGSLGAWVLQNRTVDAGGRAVPTLPSWFGQCLPPPSMDGPRSGQPPMLESCLQRLSDLGYQQEVVYQPASRFWRLQWAETGVFLGLSGLLAGFCFWRVRRI